MDNIEDSTPVLSDIVDAIIAAKTGQEALDGALRLGSARLTAETRARFVNTLICHPDSRVRFWGIMVAGRFGDQSTIPFLESRLEENRSVFDESSRNWAAIQRWKFAFLRLVELSGSSSVPRISELVASNDRFWQMLGVGAAARLPRDDRVTMLREIESRHENAEIRQLAALHLAHLSD